MNDAYDRHVTRLRVLGPDDLDERQRAMWESILAGPRGANLKAPPQALDGPFNAWLYTPAAGERAGALGEELRFRVSIPDGLKELAIVIAGARWRAEYEFWGHSRLARSHGIPQAVLDAVRDGRRPDFDDDDVDDDQALVYDFVHPLVTDGAVSDDAYRRAQQR